MRAALLQMTSSDGPMENLAVMQRMMREVADQVLCVPAAFSPATGPAHWQPLLQARAIETGGFVLAPAQTGFHSVTKGGPRSTYGHSMAISLWGDVILDAGTEPGVFCADLDLQQVDTARHKVPALTHDRVLKDVS